MARSLKKGPFIDAKLDRKVAKMNGAGQKRTIKTWARRCMISPDFVGHTLAVHNGNKCKQVRQQLEVIHMFQGWTR